VCDTNSWFPHIVIVILHTTLLTNVCYAIICLHYTVFRKKTPTYIFNYNSGISWSIFIIFVPLERKINTLQFTYLQSWWRHNCVTFHVTKVYFIELKMNIGRLYLDYNSGVSWSIFILFELWKQEWILYKESTKFTTPNCVSTLPNVKHHILRRPWPASWSALKAIKYSFF